MKFNPRSVGQQVVLLALHKGKAVEFTDHESKLL